jgi:hypothetical protein
MAMNWRRSVTSRLLRIGVPNIRFGSRFRRTADSSAFGAWNFLAEGLLAAKASSKQPGGQLAAHDPVILCPSCSKCCTAKLS